MQAGLLKFKIEDRKTMKRHRIRKEEIQMKESNYKSYDKLPLVAKLLGISISSSYELMHEKDFPALRIGNRIVVPKEAFIRWVEQHTGGTE
mgnify:CR=1 FL=1